MTWLVDIAVLAFAYVLAVIVYHGIVAGSMWLEREVKRWWKMGYRQNLLTQTEALEKWEIADLEEWLSELAKDIVMFGEAPEDSARIEKIQTRIDLEKART